MTTANIRTAVIAAAAALTEAQLAERWAIAQKTLQKWRETGNGPKFLKLGKSIRYPLAEIEAYEAANIAASTSEVSARAVIHAAGIEPPNNSQSLAAVHLII